MVEAGKFDVRVCPKTGRDCTCEAGPQSILSRMEINGRPGKLTVQKCGEIVVQKTFAEQIRDQLRANIHDD